MWRNDEEALHATMQRRSRRDGCGALPRRRHTLSAASEWLQISVHVTGPKPHAQAKARSFFRDPAERVETLILLCTVHQF